MTLVDHLLETRTPLELAKELAQKAKENVRLLDAVGALQHEVFWLRAEEDRTITLLRTQLVLVELHLNQARGFTPAQIERFTAAMGAPA